MMGRKEKVVTDLSQGIEFLMKKNKIDYFVGEGHIDRSGHITVNTVKKNLKKKSIKTSNILIATGSYAAALPNIIIDQKQVLDSTGALSLKKVPKTLAVIGAGVIGLELGSVWRRLGAKVTVIEFLDHILPGMDKELSEQMMRILAKQGISFKLSTKVTAAKKGRQWCDFSNNGR